MEKENEPYSSKVICVIGLGYVGLPLALLFAKKKMNVIGLDLVEEKVKMLNNGQSYLPDVQDDEIQKALNEGFFTATTDYEAVKKAEVIVICVPTPLTDYGTPDLSYLQSVSMTLASLLQKDQLVILESSTYPGTTKEVLQPILEKSNLKAGRDFFLAYSPERIDPGNKQFKEVDKIPKIVSGVSPQCKQTVFDFYNQVFDQVVLVSTPEVAEFTKLLENSYRFINISFINELAIMCDQLGIDLWESIEAASTKPYGFVPFYPGPGIGGHCIPVDPLYLAWKGTRANVDNKFIHLADEINHIIEKYVISQIETFLGGDLQNKAILLYGIAYKKDIDDYRESPALFILHSLTDKGAKVSFHDPFISEVVAAGERIQSVNLNVEILSKSDLVAILTDHSALPVQMILDHSKLVYDTRNVTRNFKGNAKVFRLGGGES
ncbi:nucleotide sugar dehydrogenase [Neobacillus sp. PS3-34]|uniref:nucleotide sugar dehydrogenase n=1 Tax=Neobacillus sp. PS3-34 TaxID=3070678 RepID=UPI0027DEC6AF|nr:nucleotide sugar dehydrogenase [Neobacillus sp. PS3-34]WML49009.1 nucleotide sugar dehydrogenase [Neobacillus sp. PS3-34]